MGRISLPAKQMARRLSWSGGTKASRMAAGCIACLMLLSLSTLSAQETTTQTGKLSTKDKQLQSGEYYETFDVDLAAGTTITLDLRSEDFDTFIQLNGVDEDGDANEDLEWFNDDFEESKNRSVVEVRIPVAGTYRIMVTSYAANETGAYELLVTQRAGAPNGGGGGGGEAVDRVEVGTLNKSDSKLDGGEYVDMYEIELAAGTEVVVDLTSDVLDTYLFIRSANDGEFGFDNDDFEETKGHSQITFTVPEAGVYRVYATSYAAGEQGDYRLTITSAGGEAVEVGEAVHYEEVGTLTKDDTTLNTGEFYDSYTVQAIPGQFIRVEVSSTAFDTYVMLRSPSGEQLDNDDFEGDRTRSAIEATVSEAGEYRIMVSSYSTGETGQYSLTVDVSGAGGVPATDTVLVSGARLDGSLAADDQVIEGNRFADVFYFDANAGDRIRVKLNSDQFDSYLILTSPDGTVEVFDDEGNDRNAGINQAVGQTGRFMLAATSYEAEAQGGYSLSFDRSGAEDPSSGRQIYGVFVGIADYPGDGSDLELCDVDAQTIYSLLRENYGMRAEDSVLLVNADATVGGVSEALQRIGAKAGPNDLLIFFYSGHGGQFTAEANSADPDGIHETLALTDGQITDDEFAAIFNSSEAGIALCALDACFCGGFAKDVVSARGRMGIFSSEEDVLSQVAAQFRAGGYLSRFLADALLDDRDTADWNSDRMLTAHELSHYIAERYNSDVRSDRPKAAVQDGVVDPSENASFQRPAFDRGGVRSTEVLFRW